jgi:serine/threonine protein kinase
VPAYSIEDVIEKGRFGVVYNGRHRETGSPARLIVLMAGEHGSAEELAEMRDRVGASRRFNHPNLVHVTETWTQPPDPTKPVGALWVAFEKVDGFTVEEKRGDGPIFWGTVAEWGQQLCDALDPMHEAGVFHCAVWPENIWRDIEGRTRLGYVGLGRERIVGPYAAPEQVTGNPIGAFTDVWGVGITLWTLCAGRPPFPQEDPDELIKAIKSSNPPKLPSLVGDIPANLDKVLRRAIHPKPGRRYESMTGLAADLGRVMSGQPPRSTRTSTISRIFRPFGE